MAIGMKPCLLVQTSLTDCSLRGGVLKKKGERSTKGLIIFFIVLGLVCYTQTNASENYDVIYTMVNVCEQNHHGDAHILKFSNGKVYAIDAGDEGDNGGKKVVGYLMKNKISKIDKYFITHAHKDHYGGLIDLLNSSVQILEIYLNVPEKKICDQEQPWGCDYSHFMNLLQQIKDKGIKITSIHTNDYFNPNQTTELRVLFAHNGVDPPVGNTDINDTSIIMKLSNGTQSILFTGDLNQQVGNFLTRSSHELQADIIKVPHHGTESTVTNSFFNTVGAKIALVPSPTYLWMSERSRRIREYFHDNNTRVYVSGVDGDVSLLIWKDKYQILANQPIAERNSPRSGPGGSAPPRRARCPAGSEAD
jgi:competence protein ComEC